LLTLPPLGPGHDSNDVAAGAAGADEALTLLAKGGVRAVPLRRLVSIGLDLMAGFLAPHDESDVSRTRCQASSAGRIAISMTVPSPRLPPPLVRARGDVNDDLEI
jgi:hypothetical protein